MKSITELTKSTTDSSNSLFNLMKSSGLNNEKKSDRKKIDERANMHSSVRRLWTPEVRSSFFILTKHSISFTISKSFITFPLGRCNTFITRRTVR